MPARFAGTRRVAMSKRTVLAVVLPILLLAVTGVVLAAGAPPIPSNPTGEPEVQKTPEEEAVEHFNYGLGYVEKAEKMEGKVAEAKNDKERAKDEKKIQKAWESAIREFESATAKNPAFHQAFGSLGYALRKTGDYQASLVAYDRALDLDPSYGEAIEYRGEAYLGLDRIDDAKKAYMELFSGNRPLADQLLAAMKVYLDKRRQEGGDAAALDDFASWISEREEIAGQTASVSELRDRDW
jgi:tetratricopeptide (TPR) repeat protein